VIIFSLANAWLAVPVKDPRFTLGFAKLLAAAATAQMVDPGVEAQPMREASARREVMSSFI
jgi:hypothetical protein